MMLPWRTPRCFSSSAILRLWLMLSVLFNSARCQDKKAGLSVYPGDIYLGAFFPIHMPAHSNKGSDICGPIQGEDGIQPLEMLFYALDELNSSGMLPGFTIGALVIDSCDDETRTLEQTVELIRILMTRDPMDLFPYTCADGSRPEPLPEVSKLHDLVGVIGGASSSVSLQLASLLKLFYVPQVSYLSSSSDLSNKERFPFFKRTVPSDTGQAEAIMQLLKEFGWTYVSVVYEDTNYGLKGYTELERAAGRCGVCLANTVRIEDDLGKDRPQVYDKIIERLQSKERATVVILFAAYVRARRVLLAADRYNITNEITWIASDAWVGRSHVTEGLEHVVQNSIGTMPYVYRDKGFDSYFRKLNPYTNERNPWFTEFWEDYFECFIPGPMFAHGLAPTVSNFTHGESTRSTGELERRVFLKTCDMNARITKTNGYRQQYYLHYIHDALYAFAHALIEVHMDACGKDFKGVCEAMKPGNMSGTKLLEYLEDVQFRAASGFPFHFVDGMDGHPRYSYVVYNTSNLGKMLNMDLYNWTVVGSFMFEYENTTTHKRLSLDPDFRSQMDSYPNSICSEECHPGEAKILSSNDVCCWACTPCGPDAVVVATDSGGFCTTCPLGTKPDDDFVICLPIECNQNAYSNSYAVVCLVVALLGCLVTMATAGIFIWYRDTPLIKATGLEISYYLLCSMFLSYGSSFVVVAPPSFGVCAFTRILVGLDFTMVYASILTKTNRIYRIFNEGKMSIRRPRYTSPRSQLMIVNSLVIVQLLFIILWLVASTPDVKNVYPSRDENYLVCEGADGASYLAAFWYPCVLLCACVVYAFKTRKVPYGFKETTLIGFTAYTTFILWLAFFPIYLVNDSPFLRTTAICIVLDLNATVVWCSLFLPKIYICICKPQKNTREAIMGRAESISSTAVLAGPLGTHRFRAESYTISGQLSEGLKQPVTTLGIRKSTAYPPDPRQLGVDGTPQAEASSAKEGKLHHVRFDSGVDVEFATDDSECSNEDESDKHK